MTGSTFEVLGGTGSRRPWNRILRAEVLCRVVNAVFGRRFAPVAAGLMLALVAGCSSGGSPSHGGGGGAAGAAATIVHGGAGDRARGRVDRLVTANGGVLETALHLRAARAGELMQLDEALHQPSRARLHPVEERAHRALAVDARQRAQVGEPAGQPGARRRPEGLAIDRDLGTVDAMKLSAQAAMGNVGGIIVLFIFEFLISILGMLMCGIGILLVSVPIIYAANAIAYRMVFPKINDQFNYNPPPPGAYQQSWQPGA